MQAVTGLHGRNRRLDPIDAAILRHLVRDARASYTDLGVAVGLSGNAVAQRMRRLEQAGVIRGYRALLDPALESGGVSAVVQLRTAIDADAAAVEEGLAALPEVVEVLDLAGPVDYEIRLRCSDTDRLYAVVQLVRALPGVTAMETRPVLREVLRR
jgi:Lrp/AsnC family transcriptional regulator, leucine-responsive regulatory protein